MGDRRRGKGRAYRPSLAGRVLESRQLPTAIIPAASRPIRNNPAPNDRLIDFDRYEYVANRRDGFAEITLRRSQTAGEARVRFSTDAAPPGSPYQTVSVPVVFLDGQATASAVVPLLEGAPTQQSVVVGLRVEPETAGWYAVTGRNDPSLPRRLARGSYGPPAILRIVDRAEVVPPKLLDATIDRTGVTLTFDEAMDPASVQNPRAYLIQKFERADDSWWRKTSPFIPEDSDKLVRLPVRSAKYDPATRSVHLNLSAKLTAGRFVISSPNQAGRLRARPLDPARTLKDLAGNPLSSDLTGLEGVAPGTFRYVVKSQRAEPLR